MAQPRGSISWITFAAGAVAMLAVALAVWGWMQRQDAAKLVRAAASATAVAPDLSLPPMPDAPRMPDAPVPRPR